MGRCKIVIALVRFLDGKANDPILDSHSQRIHRKPFLIVVITAATDTIAIIGNNFLASHGLTCTLPCQKVVVVATDSALVSLGTTTRSKQVVHLALVKMTVPRLDVVVQPGRDVHGNFCIRQRGLDGTHNAVEIVASKGIVRNAAPHLFKAAFASVSRNGILEKVRLNQPDGRSDRSIFFKIVCNSLSVRTIARKDVRPARTNRLRSVGAMVRASHVTIFIAQVLVVFRNHVGIDDRGQIRFPANPDHFTFPIGIIGLVVTKPNGKVRKSLTGNGTSIKPRCPLSSKIEVVLAKGRERSCCQKQQAEKKGYFIFHNY